MRRAQILFFVGITGTVISIATFVIAASVDKGSEDDFNAAQRWQAIALLALVLFGSIAAAAGMSWFRDRDY